MTDKNTGGPAFPCRIQTGGLHKCDEPPPTEIHTGMTLRDYFAAKAMQALLNNNIDDNYDLRGSGGESHSDEIAIIAYWTADSMIKERNK